MKYTTETLAKEDYPTALRKLQEAADWLREHIDESVDKDFYRCYMYGNACDIYRSEIKIAREAAGMTEKQFAEMFDVSQGTLAEWEYKERPDRKTEKAILEKLARMKGQQSGYADQ